MGVNLRDELFDFRRERTSPLCWWDNLIATIIPHFLIIQGGTAQVRYFADKEGGETIVYQEIVPEQKLVYAWQGHEANPVTLTLVPNDGGTEVSLTQKCQDNPQWIDTCLRGWSWILDSLEHYLSTGQGLSGKAWEQEHLHYKISKIQD